jgi:two-component system, NarL family, sensor kinase
MNKRLIFLFFLISNIAFAGRPIMDSLAKEVQILKSQKPSLGRDTLLITAYWNLGYHAIYFHENNAKLLLNEFEILANKTSWKPAKGMFLINKSYYTSYFDNNFSTGLKQALAAKELLKSTKNYYAIAIADIRIISIFMWNIQNVKENKDSFYNKGFKLSTDVYTLGERLHNAEIMCLGLIYKSNYYLTIGKINEAIEPIKKAESIMSKSKVSHFTESQINGTLGSAYSQLKDTNNAIYYTDIALFIAEKQQDYYALLSLYRFKGIFYASNGADLKEVQKNYEKSYEYAKKYGVLKFISLSEGQLYGVYRYQKNNAKALAFLELFAFHEDSLSKEKTQKVYADYDLVSKESKIKSLENEKLQTNVNRQKWIGGFLIFSLIALSGFLFYFYANNKKLKTKNREIEEALFKGQTIERKRVAEELHDNLSAKISGIRWRLEAIEPEFKIEKHEQIYQSSINALAEVYTDVRLIAHNLLPAELDTKGLKVALENLVNELNSLDKTQFNLHVAENIGRFKSKIEYEVFSIILELSNNVLKHAKATNAEIELETQLGFLKIKVKDNGIGINEKLNQKGMGMDNIKSRIETLNGTQERFNNNGVEINLKIPI